MEKTDRKPEYYGREVRVVSRPNGSWMAQRLLVHILDQASKEFDPWEDLVGMPLTYEEAAARARQEEKR